MASDFLSLYIPVADVVARLLHPNAEVVIQEVSTDRVYHIANPFSCRKPGDISLLKLGAEDLEGEADIIGPYEKAGEKGQTIRSVTAVLRDNNGRAQGLMCINLDYSGYEPALDLLEALIRPRKDRPHPENLFRNDWRDQIKLEIRDMDLSPLIEDGFVAYSHGQVVVPPVGELCFDEPPGDTHIKYGRIKGADPFVIKIASGFYRNPEFGLPSKSGLMLAFSSRTGMLDTMLMDRGYLTDLRTTLAAGCLKVGDILELGQVIDTCRCKEQDSRVTARASEDQATVADLTGVAVQDIQIATAACRAANRGATK